MNPKSHHHSLHIPPTMWQQFCQAMLQARGDREEVIGFFFCDRHQPSKSRIRHIPKAWVVPSPDCYEYQSASGLVLKQDFHRYLLDTYVTQNRCDIVHVHTHAGPESASFSGIDDRHEAEYARFLSARFPTKPRLISGVFDEWLQRPKFRIWNRRGNAVRPVSFCRGWLGLPKDEATAHPTQTAIPENATPETPELEILEIDPMFDRQRLFGDGVQRQLGELSVTLVGCGGLGAIFAELLGRLGVKRWTLIDPDCLETANLNRMPAATEKMARQQWPKVEYVKSLIKRIYATGSRVKGIPTTLEAALENSAARREIAAADLIVVATDNHRSRQIAQELALESMRPLLCLGTHIDIPADGIPRAYCRITVPPLGGGWCLMCGNIINLQRAALESAPPEIDGLARRAGYIEGVGDPSVFWLNGICASTAVGIVQGIIGGFVSVDSGLDWIYDFPNSNWLKTNPEYLHTPDCYFCGSGG